MGYTCNPVTKEDNNHNPNTKQISNFFEICDSIDTDRIRCTEAKIQGKNAIRVTHEVIPAFLEIDGHATHVSIFKRQYDTMLSKTHVDQEYTWNTVFKESDLGPVNANCARGYTSK